METKETKLKHLIEELREHDTEDAYKKVFGNIELWLFDKDLEMLDKFVEMIEPRLFKHFEVPIAVLRGSSRVKKELPSWSGLLERIWDDLDRRGKDTTRLMRGLV